ncbi:MAG TPA: CapA family protein [Ilumatobacter sp.]|nr:CapA family protein [Ilumatobacter sp.]
MSSTSTSFRPAGARPTTTTTTITTTTITTTTTPATTESPAPSTAPVAPTTASFAFSGDILPHSPLWAGARRLAAVSGRDGFDFNPMLAGLAPLHASVDVAICHLETPIAPAGEELSTVPYYGVPAEVVDAIAHAGFDRCSTASNHVFDRGSAGIDQTVNEFERVGIDQTGMARTPQEAMPTVFEVNDVRLSHLSYTFSFNGLRLPTGEDWRSNLIDTDRIIADAATARAAGAEAIVVSLHWGEEKQTALTTEQRSIAEQLTASGVIDLIVGHHAHVVQPIEQVNDVWVIYGLGNILSNLPASDEFPVNSQDAMVVTIDLRRDEQGAITWGRPIVYPTWVDKADEWSVLLLDEELARNSLSAGRRSVLEASRQRTLAVVGDYAVSGAAPPSSEP